MPKSSIFSNQIVKYYSGEELFRGIFFFQGSASEKIAMYSPMTEMLKKSDAKALAIRDTMANEIFSACQKNYPEYLEELETSVKNQNFYAIEQCLYKGNKILESLLLQNPKYSTQVKTVKKNIESLDLKSYDFNNQESRNKFINDLNKSHQSVNNLSNIDLAGNAKQGTCLAFAAVVAVALWNAVAAINVAVLINVVGAVLALVKTYDSTWSGAGGGGQASSGLCINIQCPERALKIDILVSQLGNLTR